MRIFFFFLKEEKKEISEREIPAEQKELCVIHVKSTTTLSICAWRVPTEHKGLNVSQRVFVATASLPLKRDDQLQDGQVSFSGCFLKRSSSNAQRVSHLLMCPQLLGVNAKPRPQ